MQLGDYLFRMGTDTVDWPGTIDKGYFYSEVWLEGKYNDYYTCIILKGFFVALCPTYMVARSVLWLCNCPTTAK